MSRKLVVVALLIAWLWEGWPQPAAAQTTPPDSAYINGVAGQPQRYNLSCESRSAVDWAAFFGVKISETEFLAALPRSDNPETGFVGSPNDPWGNVPPYSYGVHAPPVAALLQAYGLNAVAQRGLSWEELRQEVGSNGRPVIVWLVGNAWPGVAQNYTAADGRTVVVAAYEHTMILLGYDPTSVYLLNASTGLVEWHALTAFLTSWAVLGNMAVLWGEETEQTETAVLPTRFPAGVTHSYVVQPGDTLLTIAARFQLTRYELVVYNRLPLPELIYEGQVLHLPLREQLLAEATPAETTTAVAGSAPVTPLATYTVQPGEHLMQIARTLGLDWQEIARLNALRPPAYTVYPQQLLQLPTANAEPSSQTAVAPSASYIVQRGDSLFRIAMRYGLDWPTLAQLNGLSYPYRIYAGQTLRLPTTTNETTNPS